MADDISNDLQIAPLAGAGEAIEQVRSLVEEHFRPEVIQIEDPNTGTVAPAVLTKNGVTAIPAAEFDDYLSEPRDRRGTAKFTELDSLIAHVNRFKGPESVVFANDSRESPALTAVIDYHAAGNIAAPGFGRHRSTFHFPLSDEWQAWLKSDKQVMSMTDFAQFLEDRVIDVLHMIPGEDEISEDLQKYIDALGGGAVIATPSRLFELSRSLYIHETSVVREVTKLSSGEGQLVFQTDHTDEYGQPLKIPGLFLIAIPVFRRGPLYRIAARLRYRKQGGVVFWYELWRLDRTFDHAFEEVLQRVAAETELPVLRGSPEA